MSARYLVADVFDGLAKLEDDSVDLVLSSPPFLALRSYLPADHEHKHREIGSEATPADFLDTLLDVVEACDRVLAPHGSLVFELGDTFAGCGDGWPLDKSLCGIPTLFAWSLAYGRNLLRPERTTPPWRIRNVIAWCRPNPPVGALGDKFRPATSYLTVACKARDRYFDLDAVRNGPVSDPRTGPPDERSNAVEQIEGWKNGAAHHGTNPAGAPPLDYWEIPTQPYAGSHYATWPEALCVKPIASMCPPKVCRVCGKPSRRIVAVEYEPHGLRVEEPKGGRGVGAGGEHAQHMAFGRAAKHVSTSGWTDCGHNDYRPGRVLDPFAGSGTTLQVATGHGRDAIGFDIDERNAELALSRVGPLLLTIEHLGPLTEEES